MQTLYDLWSRVAVELIAGLLLAVILALVPAARHWMAAVALPWVQSTIRHGMLTAIRFLRVLQARDWIAIIVVVIGTFYIVQLTADSKAARKIRRDLIRELAEVNQEDATRESIEAIQAAEAAAREEIRAAANRFINSGSFPGHAVVAFNLAECPLGWREYETAAGRFIVGTGSHSDFDRYGLALPELQLEDEGGSRTHKLSVAEMPAHTHTYTFSSGHNSPEHVDYSEDEFGYKNRAPETSSTGNGQPHNNMPPYVALRFCEPVSEPRP